MSRTVWVFELNGREHRVELDHGFISGKRTIVVDGEVLHRSRKLFD